MSVNIFLLIAFLFCHTSSALDSANVDVAKTLVWGPGLKPNFVVPVRYIFIQPVDLNGDK